MSFRRTVLACAVTFVCALAVFTLPRFAWNSLQGAIRPPAAPDAVLPPPAIAPLVAQAAPRSAGQRLTGLFGIVVKAFAVVMNRVMGASGAESLNVAASIFMGQTEAPLTIRPFLPGMTRSELMTVMTAGMAHVSGSIMAAYIAFGIEARHLLTAV